MPKLLPIGTSRFYPAKKRKRKIVEWSPAPKPLTKKDVEELSVDSSHAGHTALDDLQLLAVVKAELAASLEMGLKNTLLPTVFLAQLIDKAERVHD